MSLPLSASQGLSRRIDAQRAAMLIALGVFFWFVGVFIVRFAATLGLLTSGWTPLFYIFVALITAPIIVLAPRLLGLADELRLACTALMVGTAAVIDGCVVRWAAWIYAGDAQLLIPSAASLLWGAGIGILLGYVLTPRGAD